MSTFYFAQIFTATLYKSIPKTKSVNNQKIANSIAERAILFNNALQNIGSEKKVNEDNQVHVLEAKASLDGDYKTRMPIFLMR